MPEPEIRELLVYIIRNLVDNPEAVRVAEQEGRRTTVYEVTVGDGDWGKVIGKEGRIADALRKVAKAAATGGRQHVSVEIMT